MPEPKLILVTGATGYIGGRLVQTAYLAPKGLLGFLYWYGLYPFHGVIFGNMIHRLAQRAKDLSSSEVATDLCVPAVELGAR